MTESIQELVHFAQHLGKEDKIHVKKEDEIYLLDAKEIHRIYTENRQIRVRTTKDTYRAQQALYQLLQILPEYFLQISQSEILNSIPTIYFCLDKTIKKFIIMMPNRKK